MDHDKQQDTRLDETYIESCIFNLIKIDLIKLIKMKVNLSKNFHIQPSEIDTMMMWEYELFIQYLNETVKEENNKQEKEMDKYHINDYKKMTSQKNLNNQMKIPSLPSMKMP